jgi:hypothetical protein
MDDQPLQIVEDGSGSDEEPDESVITYESKETTFQSFQDQVKFILKINSQIQASGHSQIYKLEGKLRNILIN